MITFSNRLKTEFRSPAHFELSRLVPAVLRNEFFGGNTGKESLVDFDIRYKVKRNGGILLLMQRKLLPLINCICIVKTKTIYVNCLCFYEEPFLRFLCRVWRSTLKTIGRPCHQERCVEKLFFSLYTSVPSIFYNVAKSSMKRWIPFTYIKLNDLPSNFV